MSTLLLSLTNVLPEYYCHSCVRLYTARYLPLPEETSPLPSLCQPDFDVHSPRKGEVRGVCRCTPDRVFALRSRSLTCLALAGCSHTRKSLSLNFELSHACTVNDNSTYASLFCDDFLIPSSVSYIMWWTELSGTVWRFPYYDCHAVNPLNDGLNPICSLLALLGAHHFLHVSRIRVKSLTFRLLMSYIYGPPILDVSRWHTTTQHSR